MDILETSTGTTKECVSLVNAEKDVVNDERLGSIPLETLKVILREIYTYWLKKRKFTEKPLIRCDHYILFHLPLTR